MIQSEINKIRCKPGCKVLLLLVAWSDGMGWWEEMSRCESLCDSNFEASMETSIGLEEMSEPNIEASIGYIMGYMIGSCWMGCIGAMLWWVPKMNMDENTNENHDENPTWVIEITCETCSHAWSLKSLCFSSSTSKMRLRWSKICAG